MNKVVMSRLEHEAQKTASKYKSWEHHIISSDSFLDGCLYVLNALKENIDINERIEVEFKEGEHQLVHKNED